MNYILESLSTLSMLEAPQSVKTGMKQVEQLPEDNLKPTTSRCIEVNDKTNKMKPTREEIEKMIEIVLDALPQLGDGNFYVNLCPR